jgi:S1-C subfamily serine protease
MTGETRIAVEMGGRQVQAVHPPLASTVNACIEFLTGSKAGTTVPLSGEAVSIGRRAGQGIAFPPGDIVVSAEHATILVRDGRYVIRDDRSRNGTFVNQQQITEHPLSDGDVIQFGFGGPLACFRVEGSTENIPTFETRKSAGDAENLGARDSATYGTRELLLLTEKKARRRIHRTIAAAGILAAGIVFLLSRQHKSDADVQRLRAGVAIVRAQSDSLSRALADNERQLLSDPRIDVSAMRNLTRGVAFIIFAYGFADRATGEWVREARDSTGHVIRTEGPRGDSVPELVIGGAGPPILEGGTASAFLVDTTGVLVTNRHVAEPWEDDPQLPLLRARGKDVIGRFYSYRAYFPPGDQSFPLTVREVSRSADVALLHTTGGPVHIPVVPLAPASRTSAPGEQVVYIGYPAGPRNLLFRVPESVGGEILGRAGDNERVLVTELARRRLIQPLMLYGRISDTTAMDLVHTAATAAGGSGGPLIGTDLAVLGVHYAAVTPLVGESFSTQRAVPVRRVWELLQPVGKYHPHQ